MSRLTFCRLCSGCWATRSREPLSVLESGTSMSPVSTLWQQRGALSTQHEFIYYVHFSVPGFLLLSGGYHPLCVFFRDFFFFLPLRSLGVTGCTSSFCFRRSGLRERFMNGFIGKVIFRGFGCAARHADVLWNHLFPAGVRRLDGTGQHVTEEMHVRGNTGNMLRLRDNWSRQN